MGDELLVWDYELKARAYDPAHDSWRDVADLPLDFSECFPMASIAPSERLRRELADVVAGIGDEKDPIEAIGRRLILQQALEEELTEFLGRERYERHGEPVSHRNGTSG
jgi:hypothetical protein